MRKKESACKTVLVCFWKHFKMKMPEIDHTNSLNPYQVQQNVWQDPREKCLEDLRNVQDKNTLLSISAQHAKS